MHEVNPRDLELREFLMAALEDVRVDMDAATVAVLLVDDAQQYLTARVAVGLEEEVRQGSRIPIGLGFAGRIAFERRPVAIDHIDSTTVVNPILWRSGITSLAGAPLLFEDRLLGVIHVGRIDGYFSAADVARLTQHAVSVARRLTDWQSQVDRTAAAALQDGLTPRLPRLPYLDLAARYVPSSQHGVGGDWYDVFKLPDDNIGFAVGDVMGHGLVAATVMGRVRSALRAYAIEDDDPASVLVRLDRKVQHFEFNQLITVVYGILDPRNGAVTVSSAGHLAPILLPAGGGAASLDMPTDHPLGVSRPAVRRRTSFEVQVGSTLFLYSDGLVEQRDVDIDERHEALLRALDGAADVWAEIVCADVMSAMLGGKDVTDDDVTVLTVRRLDSG